MNKITLKQINKINSECKQGFCFAFNFFRERGIKLLSKYITIEENRKVVEITLRWQQVHGQSGIITLLPELCVSICNKTSDTDAWVSIGLGNTHTFAQFPSPRRDIKQLCKVTENVTDELICSLLPVEEQEKFRQKVGLQTKDAEKIGKP